MALKKNTTQESIVSGKFNSLEDAINSFENEDTIEAKHLALESMPTFENGAVTLVEFLRSEKYDQRVTSYIGMLLSKIDPKKAPIDEVMSLLALENAYIRNLAITILQDYK
jgi:hypothetical protein